MNVPIGVDLNDPVSIRFWAKVDPCRTDGCAIWTAHIDLRGYGRFNLNGRHVLAHHYLVGKPPEPLEWDHVKTRGCTHRNCIWPDHLEAVTHRENIQRGAAAIFFRGRTHCPQGHPYDEVNTVRDLTGPHAGRRRCRKCEQFRTQGQKERRVAARARR